MVTFTDGWLGSFRSTIQPSITRKTENAKIYVSADTGKIPRPWELVEERSQERWAGNLAQLYSSRQLLILREKTVAEAKKLRKE